MRKEDNEPDSIDRDIFFQLVEYRTRFYENLARDSLTLLSIQLFILPVSISIFSLLIQVISESEDSPTSPVTRIINNVDYSLLRIAIIGGLFAILLTGLVYHFSRKQASKQPNLILQRYFPSTIDNDTSSDHIWTKNGIKAIEERMEINSEEYFGNDSYAEQVKRPFDNSDEALWRASFTVALIATLGSTATLLISFIDTIYSPITNVSVFFIRNALLLLSYFLIPALVIITAEKIMRWAGPSAAFSLAIIGRILYRFCQKLGSQIKNRPIPSLLFIIYLILAGSSTFYVPNTQNALTGILISIGLILGILSVILFIADIVKTSSNK